MNPDLNVLTSMITPAVLISACGALILSTSVRLGRVVDRVRALSEKFEEMTSRTAEQDKLFDERVAMVFGQLDRLTSRARLLQRTMTTFYIALGIFVATSVSIGVVSLTRSPYEWVPVVLGLFGAALLFYGSVLLGFEASMALRSIHAEMDFLWKLGTHHAPAALRSQHRPYRSKAARRRQ